jgi:CheY-like chemotaxis protein
MEKAKVLIVHDEECISHLLARMLGDTYTFLEAEDGQQTVHIARSHKPDLVLMDILMPNGDGYTACHAVKEGQDTRTIPVVMLTAMG